MSKTAAMGTVTLLPPAAQSEAKRLMPPLSIERKKFFKELKERDQEKLREETRHLATAIMMHGMAGVAIGAHLANVQEILAPKSKKGKGYFGQFLRSFHISPKSAYRAIVGYQNAAQRFPENVLKAAMIRGIKIVGYDEKRPLGAFTEPVRLLPPPRNPDATQANRYIDQLLQTARERRSAHRKRGGKNTVAEETGDPNELLKGAYRSLNVFFRRLPHRSNTRRAWVDKLVGMLLNDLGVSTQQTFAPIAVPGDLRPKPVGRPALEKDEEEEATAATA